MNRAPDDPMLSVVVPVYRSAPLLPSLVERLSAALEKEGRSWEIVLVDDSSPDQSYEVLRQLRAREPRLRIVQFARNQGQQHATLCGLNYARGAEVVTIDDDLQSAPEEIPILLAKLREGYLAVLGRIGNKRHGWWRNAGSRVHQYLAEKIIAKPPGLYLSSFRALSRAAVDRLVRYKGAHPHISALLLKSVPASAIANADVSHAPRSVGGSTYTLRKLVKFASFLLINHSYIPLRFMTAWGFALSLLSLLFAAWVVARALFFGHAPSGWPSLSVLVAFLSGNILMALGIVGEYLGRLVEEDTVTEQFAIHREEV
ncbi:MAG: glycosyltransferase family 2 protein [Burkholderiales bacterium]